MLLLVADCSQNLFQFSKSLNTTDFEFIKSLAAKSNFKGLKSL